MTDQEFHSNPLAPSDDELDEDDKPRLSNADFRKLLMTPRISGGLSASAQPTSTFAKPKPVEKKESTDANKERKKKKSYYAQLKKDEGDREKELATKYRDRAKERRDGLNNDQGQTIDISTTANYKAVAPDARIGQSLAERRRQVIEESKYLGGDMEHTHLVKGLDYALLEKVKAEMVAEEMEALEKMKKREKENEDDDEEDITFRTKLGRNIVKAALSRRGLIERNDNFLPGRMVYKFDLDNPLEDYPTTQFRSKAEFVGVETSTTLSNNDIVINKLIQILSCLRQGKGRDKKKKDKREKEKTRREEDMLDLMNRHMDMFEPSALTDYKSNHSRHHKHEMSRSDRKEGKRSYFEKPSEEESKFEGPKLNAKEFIKNINDRYGKNNWGGIGEGDDDEEAKLKGPTKDQQDKINKFNNQMEIDSYAECYPGMMEMVDTLGDSDDEADYTKMDQGNKKGPVGRWDFETQEEYSSYMSSREALPKAAFQYGVKMADGRKTRRAGPRDEKKELDREWTKIQGILSKRKDTTVDAYSAYKKAKY